jgi:hypothetical protein
MQKFGISVNPVKTKQAVQYLEKFVQVQILSLRTHTIVLGRSYFSNLGSKHIIRYFVFSAGKYTTRAFQLSENYHSEFSKSPKG